MTRALLLILFMDYRISMSKAAEWSAFRQCFAELDVMTMARPLHLFHESPTHGGGLAYPVLVDNKGSFSQSFMVLRHCKDTIPKVSA
jgi:hypothetical protein